MAVTKSGAMENPLPPVVEEVNGLEPATERTSSGTSVGITRRELGTEATLCGVLNHLMESVFDHQDSRATPTVNRIKESVLETAPLFHEAIQNTRRDVVQWTGRGSPLRALLVVSVGTVALVALTGMLVFMLVFVTATVNAIIISFLVSLAAVGGFLAIFFSFLAAVYTGVLCIAASVTFTVTVSSMVAALVATGGIGIIWIMGLAAIKVANLVKHFLSIGREAVLDKVSGGQNTHYWRELGQVD